MQSLPSESLFIGRNTGFGPPSHTNSHTYCVPSLKDSISRLNELFKTEGLFPDPWLCKSHCCQPIKQVQGPHSQGEQTTEIERIERTQNRTSWFYSGSAYTERGQCCNNKTARFLQQEHGCSMLLRTQFFFTSTKWTLFFLGFFLMQTSKLRTRSAAWSALIEEAVCWMHVRPLSSNNTWWECLASTSVPQECWTQQGLWPYQAIWILWSQQLLWITRSKF